MKRYSQAILVFLLVLALVTPFGAARARAEDNLDVLNFASITPLPAGVLRVNQSGTSVDFIVPYYHETSVDLSSLDISSRDGYENVDYDLSGAAFGSVGVGESAPLTVTYEKDGETGETTYQLSVKKGEPSVFTGSISDTIPMGEKTFDWEKFSKAYDKKDGDDLSYIVISGPGATNPAGSAWKLGASTYNFTDPIKADNIGTLSFTSSAVGDYSFDVTAYDGKGGSFGPIKLNIEVKVVSVASEVAFSVYKGASVRFSLAAFQAAFTSSGIGGDFNYIKFDTLPISTSSGVLRYNSTNGTLVSADAKYYVTGTNLIGNIYFVANATNTNAVTIQYTGYNTSDQSYTGQIRITVLSEAADIVYRIRQGETQVFSLSDFTSACANTVTGTLSHIVITSSMPGSSTQGTLRQNYASSSSSGANASSNTSYYRTNTNNALLISRLAFIPVDSFTGSITLNYTGYNTSNVSFTGRIRLVIVPRVHYTTVRNEAKFFTPSDFNSICSSVMGETLSYIQFDAQPSSSYGTVKYSYSNTTGSGTNVTVGASGTKCYYSGSSTPQLSSVAFVPANNYTGAATISYTAYSTGGRSYKGQIQITVEAGASADILYTAARNTPVAFVADDFNTAFVSSGIGGTFSYITFTLPAASNGTLYYNYNASASTNTRVAGGSNYYRSGSGSTLLVGNITYVPSSASYSGAVTINFKGYNTGGRSFDGRIRIAVMDPIGYETTRNAPVTFTLTDFTSACTTATGGSLDYVTFTLPASSQGALRYNYVSASSAGTALTSATKCYRSGTSPLVGQVTFVPANNFSGAVTVNYTGVNAGGVAYKGVVVITVREGAGGSKYFTDVASDYSWAVSAIDNLYEKKVINGVTAITYLPGAPIKRGDFMLMLYRAYGLNVSNTFGNFPDVPANSYYVHEIAVARALGIARGDNSGRFRPEAPITREDAMVLVMRTLEIVDSPIAANSTASLVGFTDTNLISEYAWSAVATLVKAGIIQGNNGRINPKGTLTRAEMAVIVDRLLG